MPSVSGITRLLYVTILVLTLVGFLLYLLYEKVTLDRRRAAIPLVISVTGTRGKSSVVRFLASVLRESGRSVLAKTTGSQAQYVLPDGTIRDVPRRGTVREVEPQTVIVLGFFYFAGVGLFQLFNSRWIPLASVRGVGALPE